MDNTLMSSLKHQIELLKRHVKILDVLVSSDKPIGILKLSKMTTYPPHQVRYSLRELEQAKIIGPSTKGASLGGEGKEIVVNLDRELDAIRNAVDSLSGEVKAIQAKLK